jgi:RHS repeat-associated protein
MYTFDALNRRFRIANASNTIDYQFDAAGRRTVEWQESTNFGIRGNVYWGNMPIAFHGINGTEYFEQQDWLGTERVRTNYTGAVVGSYASLAFGDGFSASGTDEDPYHFAGTHRDSESATDHAQFLQFREATGRWMSPDPYDGSYDWSNPQSYNRYAYVMGNPSGLVDPTGQDPFTIVVTSICGVAPGACESAGFNPISAIVLGSILGGAEIAALLGLFDGPPLQGTIHPRPNAPNALCNLKSDM